MKDLFSNNADITRNAYLNWRTKKYDPSHNLHVLAESYADAAIALINTVLKDNSDKKADSLTMPIMYCIDHSIEVYLKAIIRKIETIICENPSNYTNHDINELYNTLFGLIKKKEVKTKGLNKHLSPVSKFINELYSRIQITNEYGKKSLGIDFARYPIKVDGTPHFYVTDDENIVIDVENLSKRFTEIRNCLESLYLMYNMESENIKINNST